MRLNDGRVIPFVDQALRGEDPWPFWKWNANPFFFVADDQRVEEFFSYVPVGKSQ